MTSKIDDRFAHVELTSTTDPTVRDQIIESSAAIRFLCFEHVRLFGPALAMWLLWQKPLRRVKTRISIQEKHKMYAVTGDDAVVSRWFYPAKFEGYCFSCKKITCIEPGCALTNWGAHWARFECWAEEMRWVNHREAQLRTDITDYIRAMEAQYRVHNFDRATWGPLKDWYAQASSIPDKYTDTITTVNCRSTPHPEVEVGNPLSAHNLEVIITARDTASPALTRWRNELSKSLSKTIEDIIFKTGDAADD